MKRYKTLNGRHWVTHEFILQMQEKFGNLIKRLPGNGFHVYTDMTGSHEIFFIEHPPISEVFGDEKLWEAIFHSGFEESFRKFIQVVLRKEKMPRKRLVSEVDFSIWNTQNTLSKTARIPGGQYGFTKKIETLCSGANRRLQRKATALVKKAVQKDAKVLDFLQTHSKRAKSIPAKTLISAYRDSLPRLASKIACEGQCSCGGSCGCGDFSEEELLKIAMKSSAKFSKDLEFLENWISKNPGKTRDEIFQALGSKFQPVRIKHLMNELLDEARISMSNRKWYVDNWRKYANASEMLLRQDLKNEFARYGGRLSKDQLKKIVSNLARKHHLSNPRQIQMMIARLKREKVLDEAGGSVMWVRGRMASKRKYGMYGFLEKTANLGLEVCSQLRHEAGHIASDLHMRKSDLYDPITKFLTQHGKTARCNSSKLLLSVYPESHMFKTANTPKNFTVEEWLSFEPEP